MRHVDDTLNDLKALCQDANTATANPVTGDLVPTYQFFIMETELPGGTLQTAPPVGVLECARYNRTWREAGMVGSPQGMPNIYWVWLLDSLFQPSDTRVAQGQDQIGLVNAIMEALNPPDGSRCFAGVEWVTVGLVRPPYLRFGSQQYRGSQIVISLDERCNDADAE